jgi:signal transduction histidine kinase/CheY-like chemotaxis protein
MLYEQERLRLAARTSCTREFAAYLEEGIPVNRETTSGRAALERRPVQIPDFFADPEVLLKAGHTSEGVRTILAVPMLRGERLLGVITVWRREVRPFSEHQTKLLETFADQAVIAIENVRLFDGIREKTRQLELANTYKSRFLAAASHDLRQPLHALNLFVAQLGAESDEERRRALVVRIDAAVNAMNELFDALLDMSKLEAGLLEPNLTEFPLERVFKRIEATFAEAARMKGLRFKVVATDVWIRSDFILLERILMNLVSNAVRYTSAGGVIVGARRRGEWLRLDVWDSGPGIPQDQQQNIFGEFYQLASAEVAGRGGLGLGLAIVDRLGHLLGHAIGLRSALGKGSRFSVSVPLATAQTDVTSAPRAVPFHADPLQGKLILVIDDDALVLDGMRGILQAWGCDVTTAASEKAAVDAIARLERRPELIISDYRLGDGRSGIEAIEGVRRAAGVSIPAFLVSGDTAPERLRDAAASHCLLLHKPVAPIKLRAVLSRLLKGDAVRRPQSVNN